MNKKVIQLILMVFAVFVFIILPLRSQAQVAANPEIAVSPSTFEFDVIGGEKFQRQIKFFNNSSVALPIKVRVVDFDAADERGGIRFLENINDSFLFSARQWIKPKIVDFIVEPNQLKTINLTISIPHDAIPGGHYTTVLFEPKLPSFYYQDQSTKVIPIIGSLILFNVQKINIEALLYEKNMQITDFHFLLDDKLPMRFFLNSINNILAIFKTTPAFAGSEPIVYTKAPKEIMLRLKNINIFHIKPTGSIKVYNIFNNLISESRVPMTTILPGRARQIPLQINWYDNAFMIGKYKAVLDLEIDGEISNEIIDFWVLPWKLVFSTFMGSLLLFYFMLHYRGRIIAFLKVLFTKK